MEHLGHQIDAAPEWMSPFEAATFTRHSTSSLAKRRLTGMPPVFHKFGKKVLYKKSDLDDWLQSGRRVSTSDTGQDA